MHEPGMPERLRGFNPTLVRLRPVLLHDPQIRRGPFQSHAGSIEAVTMSMSTPSTCMVSIPRWFD